MLKSKFIFNLFILSTLLGVVHSCHNINKEEWKNQNSIATYENLYVIDTIAPPKDLDRQETLLDTLLSQEKINILFNKDSGEVFLVFERASHENVFPLEEYIGFAHTPMPPYLCKIKKVDSINIGIEIIFGYIQTGSSQETLGFFEFNIVNRKLTQLFNVLDVNGRWLADDTLYSFLYDHKYLRDLPDSNYAEYEYNIDFKNKKLEIKEYYPFKPLPDKYKDVEKKYNIKYLIKHTYLYNDTNIVAYISKDNFLDSIKVTIDSVQKFYHEYHYFDGR